MLQVTIPSKEYFNTLDNTFVSNPGQSVQLEHSLISISKWESKWKKPYFSGIEKTREEQIDYIRCMTITPNTNYNSYYNIPRELFEKINNYINDEKTATWFNDKGQTRGSKRVVTSELVYSWMVALNIPFECQKWHFSRLSTLIRVCNEETNANSNKMSKKDTLARNHSINAARKQQMRTGG